MHMCDDDGNDIDREGTRRGGQLVVDFTAMFRSLQRLRVAGEAAWGAFRDPTRAELVSALGETTGGRALVRMREQMEGSEEGMRVLETRPVIGRELGDAAVAAWEARGRPEREEEGETLREAHGRFLGVNGFDPEERPKTVYVEDEELAYVMTRYRQVHDLWHALFDVAPDVEGEVMLKWIEASQTGLPMNVASALAGPWISSHVDAAARVRLFSRGIPWAIRAGRGLRVPLLAVMYEDRLDVALSKVRKELGVVPWRGV